MSHFCLVFKEECSHVLHVHLKLILNRFNLLIFKDGSD